MSTWETTPNVFAAHMDPIVVPVALRRSELTEAILSFPVLSVYTEHRPVLHHFASEKGMMGDNLDQPNRH